MNKSDIKFSPCFLFFQFCRYSEYTGLGCWVGNPALPQLTVLCTWKPGQTSWLLTWEAEGCCRSEGQAGPERKYCDDGGLFRLGTVLAFVNCTLRTTAKQACWLPCQKVFILSLAVQPDFEAQWVGAHLYQTSLAGDAPKSCLQGGQGISG